MGTEMREKRTRQFKLLLTDREYAGLMAVANKAVDDGAYTTPSAFLRRALLAAVCHEFGDSRPLAGYGRDIPVKNRAWAGAGGTPPAPRDTGGVSRPTGEP